MNFVKCRSLARAIAVDQQQDRERVIQAQVEREREKDRLQIHSWHDRAHRVLRSIDQPRRRLVRRGLM